MLAGGELVLTTGLELEKEPGLTASFIRSLEEAAAAGLIVELFGDREAQFGRAARGRRPRPPPFR